jgi:drug/metabolite transporter (DMT)-like permease|tara:strand:+ start:4601 stop:4996 length:396 start_codon:yes stop_codon:yes gene_type:complete
MPDPILAEPKKEVDMQVTALIIFIVVAMVGSAMLMRKRKGLRIPPFIIRSHGVFAILGVLLLLIGVFESWLGGVDNSWTWVSAALLSGVVAGGYLLFGKLLKGRRKPISILYLHGIFACISISTLLYALAV